MPRPTSWRGGPALWISCAAWTRACARRYGDARMLAADAVFDPAGALALADAASANPAVFRTDGTSRSLYRTLGAAFRDVQRVGRSRLASRAIAAYRPAGELGLVIQYHELAADGGIRLARRHGCPAVLHLDAPIVWEAAKWGFERPWGHILERWAESPVLRRADLVACVSDQVAEAAVALGVARSRTVVTPSCVDAELFQPPSPDARAEARERLGIPDGSAVVGWSGQLRAFHGLDVTLHALATLVDGPSVVLLVVGDGPQRNDLERLAADLGVADRVFFVGAVGHATLPAVLAAVDIAVVTAPARQGFHYSPLKLREYMALELPVIVPEIDDVVGWVDDDVALVYQPGDATALARGIAALASDPERRRRLGAAGRAVVEASFTWDVNLARITDALAAS